MCFRHNVLDSQNLQLCVKIVNNTKAMVPSEHQTQILILSWFCFLPVWKLGCYWLP